MNKLIKFFIQTTFILIQELINKFVVFIFTLRKPKNIDGQLALVTGGARGLGKAIAIRLAQEKCNIAICDVDLEEAQKTCDELREKYFIACEAFKADISDTEQVDKMHHEIMEKIGTVDILVNNAGIVSQVGILEGKDADIVKLLNINLTSHFWMVRKFLPSMIEQQRGHIVVIDSVGGKIAYPFAGSYCASKFGINGLYKSLYEDICMYNHNKFIKITTIYPGYVNTRSDLNDLLKKSNKYLPTIEPDDAADEIVKAVLLNHRELVLPFAYKIFIKIDDWFPPKTLKFIKRQTYKMALKFAEERKQSTDVSLKSL